MKKVNFLYLLFLLLISNICFSQISISDKSAKPTIKAIPYDGSFMNFNSFYSSTDKEKMAGVVGEKITLIDGYFDIKDENGEDISYTLKDEFKNKTFNVIEYIDDYSPRLKIKNELGIFIFTPSNTDHYLFNRYLDYVNTNYLNRVFVPLYNKTSITSIGGQKIEFLGTKEYKISDVKFSKLNIGYGIVFKINNSFECIMDLEEYSEFGGKHEKGWVEIKGIGVLESDIILVEKDVFNKFLITNKQFLNNIRNKEIKVGMTEKQCRYSWGMPNTGHRSMGYDVLVWGSGNYSTRLYFKNKKLQSIR
jgi:hypothetical protein